MFHLDSGSSFHSIRNDNGRWPPFDKLTVLSLWFGRLTTLSFVEGPKESPRYYLDT